MSLRSIRFLFLATLLSLGTLSARAQDVLIPMDIRQSNHLKAYGIVFWLLEQGETVDWLLNYRGGSFLTSGFNGLEQELQVRGVHFERIDTGASARIIAEVESEEHNTAVVRLETAPNIAVYAPEQTLPWDDAVLLALEYAEVTYDMLYDDKILDGNLREYDWLHLHHEDFTGQYGKFLQYRNIPWYIEQQRDTEQMAARYGFRKASRLKLEVAQTIKEYVRQRRFSVCHVLRHGYLRHCAGGSPNRHRPGGV